MSNTNCLDGLRCPECGSFGPFKITTRCVAVVYDDGIDETHDHEWDSNSPILCDECDHAGDVGDFTER